MAHDLDTYKLDLTKDVNAQEDPSREADRDTRFVHVPGGMWEDFAVETFTNRIKLELNLATTTVYKFLGEWFQNRVGVEYKSNDMATSDEDAELLNGIYRNDFVENSGKVAIDNAVTEVATCGYGAFKLASFFIDEGDPENDLQGIKHVPICNAYDTIFWDSNAKRTDKKDATRCIELIPFTAEAFAEAYPDADFVTAYTPRNEDTSSNIHQPKIIYVAKRYDVVKSKETIFVYTNLVTKEIETYSDEDHELIKDELSKDEFRTFKRKRKIVKQQVETVVFSGADILEKPKRIAGKWIPIIPVYGYRHYVKGVEWYKGLVRDLKDAARLFVVQVSKLAENAASGGTEIPIFAPEQMLNPSIKASWSAEDDAYRLAEPIKNPDGSIAFAGPVGYTKNSMLDPNAAALMDVVPRFIQDKTGGVPQDITDKNMSGKLFRAIQKRADLTTGAIDSNIKLAIVFSGEVYKDMALDGIYTVPRMVNTLSSDGTEGRKQLLHPVLDKETGTLVETNNLSDKRFKVHADVGAQYETLREQSVEELKGVLEILPKIAGGEKYTPVVLGALVDNIEGVGFDALKKFNRKIMILQGDIDPESDDEKKQLAEAQKKSNQDPNAELTASITEQQKAEARNLDAASLEKAASAGLKQAQTRETIAKEQEIIAGIDISRTKANSERQKTLLEIRKDIFQPVEQLPL